MPIISQASALTPIPPLLLSFLFIRTDSFSIFWQRFSIWSWFFDRLRWPISVMGVCFLFVLFLTKSLKVSKLCPIMLFICDYLCWSNHFWFQNATNAFGESAWCGAALTFECLKKCLKKQTDYAFTQDTNIFIFNFIWSYRCETVFIHLSSLPSIVSSFLLHCLSICSHPPCLHLISSHQHILFVLSVFRVF